MDKMLDGMTPQEFDEILAFDSISPLSCEPDRNLMLLFTTLLLNQWREEEAITENQVREYVGLPVKEHDEQAKEGVSPESVANMVRMLAR